MAELLLFHQEARLLLLMRAHLVQMLIVVSLLHVLGHLVLVLLQARARSVRRQKSSDAHALLIMVKLKHFEHVLPMSQLMFKFFQTGEV